MLRVHRGIVCLALMAACTVVTAQGAAKPEAAAAAAAAEAAAAMERAQRQASNPMRIILEASKRARAKEAEAAAAQAGTASVPVRTDGGVIVPKSVPPVAAEPAVASAEATLSADAMQRRTSAVAVPAMDLGGVTTQAVAALAALAVPAPPAALMRPTLVNMVEPVIPARVLDEVGRINEVAVDLTIRADGTVSSVAIVPPAPRQIQRYVVAALEQWRFGPLPAARVHRVQLVFNNER